MPGGYGCDASGCANSGVPGHTFDPSGVSSTPGQVTTSLNLDSDGGLVLAGLALAYGGYELFSWLFGGGGGSPQNPGPTPQSYFSSGPFSSYPALQPWDTASSNGMFAGPSPESDPLHLYIADSRTADGSQDDAAGSDADDGSEPPTPSPTSLWDEKWFNVHFNAVLGDPSGALQTDSELGNGYGTLWVPVAEGGVVEGGFYYTGGRESTSDTAADRDGLTADSNLRANTTQPYGAFGAYFGRPGAAEFFVQSEITGAAPNVQVGARAGVGEMSISVDAAPLVDIGAKAQENLERNLYDYTQFMSEF